MRKNENLHIVFSRDVRAAMFVFPVNPLLSCKRVLLFRWENKATDHVSENTPHETVLISSSTRKITFVKNAESLLYINDLATEIGLKSL